MWSVSEAKTFKRCPRQWYFKHRLASPKATRQVEKRAAYLLSVLQSVAAWRGQVVDQVLEHYVVPALMHRQMLSLADALCEARSLFDQQLAFARASRAREPDMNKKKGGLAYAALLIVEETGNIPDDVAAEAWEEIERAMRTLYTKSALWEKLRAARRLLPQHTLWHKLCGHTLRAIPDLIAFFTDEPPLIIDWKVHYAGNRDSSFQLETYALALARAEGVDRGQRWGETDIRLAEVQLLTGQVRHYRLDADRVPAVENQILASITEIEVCTEGQERDAIDPFTLPVTRYAETCAACGFKTLCWKTDHDDRN
jgi:CRISPR/Cas system-associated exonuclease Cas4 (RecB family)